ncbi:uncharacterized protein EI90DRAFT_3293413 [Cantharellus anzutake]|uniref:uncharacterized protein n=1 Tax=Cantharellus anzutake TaxID=1750568 RepID=UPI001905C079|nr:uncharacterized protein EI90DRAFT_3293413 [Cantharellus anzutake]KAF8318058.1 hypothetical protein EI90DRAFT_3293413 [Cantharellus anzutake]
MSVRCTVLEKRGKGVPDEKVRDEATEFDDVCGIDFCFSSGGRGAMCRQLKILRSISTAKREKKEVGNAKHRQPNQNSPSKVFRIDTEIEHDAVHRNAISMKIATARQNFPGTLVNVVHLGLMPEGAMKMKRVWLRSELGRGNVAVRKLVWAVVNGGSLVAQMQDRSE